MRGFLTHNRLEQALLYRQGLGESNTLGEETESYSPLGEYAVGVQPLGEEAKVKAGLSADSETLRVQFVPAEQVTPGDQLALRGREWTVVRAEVWQSYTAVLVEPL